MNEPTSMLNRLSAASAKRLQSTTAGVGILTTVIVLSAILSAVFFWRHSAAVFSGLPVILATGLGLAIGLIPSEGAFFGWKRIRATKADMTKAQLQASGAGLWAAVGFAVANVLAIFVSSFSGIPEGVQQLSSWIVFFALMLPIPTQFILYAWFVISEQSVVENHNAAKLHALSFAAWIKTEEARIEAVIQGAEAALNRQLTDYGATVGGENAARALSDGQRDIIGRHYANGPRTAETPPAPQLTAADVAAHLALAQPAPGNSTQAAQHHDAPPASGHSAANGPAAKPLAGQGGKPADFR